jgi:hypothetical protein
MKKTKRVLLSALLLLTLAVGATLYFAYDASPRETLEMDKTLSVLP